MQKFLVLYLTPVSVLDEWMKADPETRKEAESKMKAEWDAWLAANAHMIKETSAAGKTKLSSKDGIADSRNNIMMYSIVEAESLEAAAEIFRDHPHLGIPHATIEIMKSTPLNEMSQG